MASTEQRTNYDHLSCHNCSSQTMVFLLFRPRLFITSPVSASLPPAVSHLMTSVLLRSFSSQSILLVTLPKVADQLSSTLFSNGSGTIFIPACDILIITFDSCNLLIFRL